MDEPLIGWGPLIRGYLAGRPNRFTAEVVLENGTMVVAHCPNSGRMTSCSEKGRPVFLRPCTHSSRKLAYTWEMIDMPSSYVIVNTHRANQIARQAILRGLVEELRGYTSVRSEVKTNARSRIDFLLEQEGLDPCLVEVKSVTMVTQGGRALFPDAVSRRALKHVRELAEKRIEGLRTVMFFVIMRMDAKIIMPSWHIDWAYSSELEKAVSKGLEVISYDTVITPSFVALGKKIPFILE